MIGLLYKELNPSICIFQRFILIEPYYLTLNIVIISGFYPQFENIVIDYINKQNFQQ